MAVVKERPSIPKPRSIMLRVDATFAAWLRSEAKRTGVTVPEYTRHLKIVRNANA